MNEGYGTEPRDGSVKGDEPVVVGVASHTAGSLGELP